MALGVLLRIKMMSVVMISFNDLMQTEKFPLLKLAFEVSYKSNHSAERYLNI